MLKAALVGTLAGGLFLAACSPFGGASVFHCEQDSQCSPGGGCKMPEGLCTVPNGACPTGQEYGPNSGSMSGKCVGDDLPMPDAPIDAPTMCTPNAKTCFNHAIETCKAGGDGFDPAQKEQCAITCDSGATTCSPAVASNIPVNDQRACNATGTALALSPAAGTTVTIAQTEITCAPMCNAGGTTSIPRTSAAPNNFFCLAAINIPSGVTINVTATSATTLFSHGAVVINSNITANGGNATGVLNNSAADEVAGAPVAGGFAGAAGSGDNNSGLNGLGSGNCGGRGGPTGGAAGDRAGAGGGGGGNQSAGGNGGDALTGVGATVTGGAAGTSTACSSADLRPLVGGAGGGSGGDGACTVGFPCGWPGGAGGGALQIVSRSMISGTGTLSANGGDGFGEGTQPGGGGGGGAGGGLLLEAPTVSFTGPLQVNGGTGGRSEAAAAGGAGASGGTPNGTDGTDANANDQGGAGGGGAGGRIRINATGAACPGTASPTASCSTGALRTTP